LQKYDEPLLTVADIRKKRDVLDRVCQPIASKPAPPPPKPAATAAPPPAAEAEAAATPAEGEQAAAAGGDDGAEPMEADGMEKAAAEADGEMPMEQ
jgi:heat shock protein 4